MAEPVIPWWQRELNARLARAALRRAALRRIGIRVGGALVLVLGGLLLLFVFAASTRRRLASFPMPPQPPRAVPTLSASPVPARAASTRVPPGGATITLDPPPVGAGGGSLLRVTLTGRDGSPLPGITIWVTIGGPAPYRATGTTGATGVATFPAPGAGRPYTVTVRATQGGHILAVTTTQVGDVPQVATTGVTGRFYASAGACTYTTPPARRPVLVAHFPSINFAGRPFTDSPTTANARPIPVRNGPIVLGMGRLNHFNAAFTGRILVRYAGTVRFTFLIDDAFNFGVGGGARRAAGTMTNPPASGRTALRELPVVGAFNQGHLQALTTVSVRFPRPGSYPYEIDYAECMQGGESLRVSSGGQFLAQSAR